MLSRRVCCCGSTDTKFCVTTCGTSTAGILVTVVGQGSCTTDATGCCTMTIPSGTYTVKATMDGTVIYNVSRSITAGTTVNIPIPSPTAHRCCGNCAIPNTLHITDNFGTWAATYSSTLGQWFVAYDVSHSGSTSSGTCGSFSDPCLAASATIDLHIIYYLTCSPGNQLNVWRQFNVMLLGFNGPCVYGDWNSLCDCGPIPGAYNCTTHLTYPIFLSPNSSLTAPWSACSPFNWSATPTFNGYSPSGCDLCNGGGPPDPCGAVVITP